MAGRCRWACLGCLVKLCNFRFYLYFGLFSPEKGHDIYIESVMVIFGGKKFEFNVTACVKV